jgi:hypothetical protein
LSILPVTTPGTRGSLLRGLCLIAITLDLYSHVTPTMQRDAAAVLDAVLRR